MIRCVIPRHNSPAMRLCGQSWTVGRQGSFTKAVAQRNFASAKNNSLSLNVVDLRGAGWSLLERLCAEEFLSQHISASSSEDASWLVIGNHEATEHRHLELTQKAPKYVQKAILESDDLGDGTYNSSCAVILHDKNHNDVDVSKIERDGVLCLESPNNNSYLGGSVVVDHTSILTTFLSAAPENATVDFMTEKLWAPTFTRLEEKRVASPSAKKASTFTMVMDTKSSSKGDSSGKFFTLEELGVHREEDDNDNKESIVGPIPLNFQPPHQYCLGAFPVGVTQADPDKKAVRSVFYWDYYDENHEWYYSSGTSPLFFKLKDIYQEETSSKMMSELLLTCQEQFSVEQVLKARDVQALMDKEKTGLKDWWKNRSQWKILQGF